MIEPLVEQTTVTYALAFTASEYKVRSKAPVACETPFQAEGARFDRVVPLLAARKVLLIGMQGTKDSSASILSLSALPCHHTHTAEEEYAVENPRPFFRRDILHTKNLAADMREKPVRITRFALNLMQSFHH